MRIIGIDCGKDGYVALLEDKEFREAWPTPTVKISSKGTKRDYSPADMAKILRGALPDLVVIEKQQSMPGQGVSSTFSTGRGFGLWEGICVGLHFRYVVVHPRTWQKVMCRDIQGDDTKARSILAAGRYFPGVDLRDTERCRKAHDGKCDAMLLALYGFSL